MPRHKLNLKVGSVVMLLRNLSLRDGLCNGTRLKVCNLQDNIIDAEILTGFFAGQRTLIPRITFCPNDTNLPFQLKRVQFPLRLSYAVTINKSQGQTYEKVGIFLRRPCFSHGQLYVAFSRTRAFNCVKVQICNSFQQGYARRKCYTKNVVYPQILWFYSTSFFMSYLGYKQNDNCKNIENLIGYYLKYLLQIVCWVYNEIVFLYIISVYTCVVFHIIFDWVGQGIDKKLSLFCANYNFVDINS